MALALDDSDHFLHLMQRYEGKLLHYIKRLSNISLADCEDILQEVFIKTYENLNDFDRSLKFSSWIYRITYNHTISFFRKNKKRMTELSSEDSEALFAKLSSDLNLHKKVESKIKSDRVRDLLSELDKKYRDVLILKFLEEKDYNEISNILKKPMGTVATLVNRAKSKFQEILSSNHISAT